jgi:Mce-associated membrane protein
MTVLDEQTRQEQTRQQSAPRTAYVVAVGILLVAGAILAFVAHQGQGAESDREDALASAEKRLPALLTYRHDHLGADLGRAVEQTTGSFREDYAELVSSTVRPTAGRRKVDTRATVSGAGVVRAGDDRVVVLAFLTQSTVTAGGAPAVSGSRVEATMVRVGGDWLIGELKPV